MSYFISDIKKLYKSKLIRTMLIFIIVIVILDPISIYYNDIRYKGFFNDFGANPFQFWLLMNSSGWGNAIYHTLLWIFPVISTGLILFQEKSTSLVDILIVKKSRNRYFLSKIASVFIITFLNFLLMLMLNLFITYMIFSVDAPKTEQYSYIVPQVGMFSAYLYNISPIVMAIVYSIMNAMVISLLSVLVCGIHMNVKFKNAYSAFLFPFITIYLLNYVSSLLLINKSQYNLGVIIQPRAASALVNTITREDVVVSFGILLLVDLIVVAIGFVRNREIL